MPHPGTPHHTLSPGIDKWIIGRHTSSFRLYGYTSMMVQGQCSVFQATSQHCTPSMTLLYFVFYVFITDTTLIC